MSGGHVGTGYAEDNNNVAFVEVTYTVQNVANRLIAQVSWDDPSNTITATVTDHTGGSAQATFASAAAKRFHSGDSHSGQIFELKVPPASGSRTFRLTPSATTTVQRFRIWEESGLDSAANAEASSGNDQTTPGTGTDAITSGASGSTTSANCYVMGFTEDDSELTRTGTVSAGTGYTLLGSTGSSVMAGEAKSVSSAGAQTATFTQSNNNDALTFVVAFKESSGLTLAVDRAVIAIIGREVTLTAPAPQILKPELDVVAGAWLPNIGGSPYALYPMIDEASVDESDYIYTLENSYAEVLLQPGVDPQTDEGHIMRYRLSGSDADRIIVTLKQYGSGGTIIKQWDHNPAPDVPTTYVQILSAGEAALIDDYANLVLSFEAIR